MTSLSIQINKFNYVKLLFFFTKIIIYYYFYSIKNLIFLKFYF